MPRHSFSISGPYAADHRTSFERALAASADAGHRASPTPRRARRPADGSQRADQDTRSDAVAGKKRRRLLELRSDEQAVSPMPPGSSISPAVQRQMKRAKLSASSPVGDTDMPDAADERHGERDENTMREHDELDEDDRA